jgi:hypothetical protein
MHGELHRALKGFCDQDEGDFSRRRGPRKARFRALRVGATRKEQ